jgi:2-oxoglutarate ferredoxin oxidoreductase subunit alpha
MSVDACFMIAGEAGQGLQSIGQILARTLARGGFHVFVDQDYESRVRGGHNFVRVRASDSEIRAVSEVVNVLIALNAESMDLHLAEVSTDGVVVFDSGKSQDASGNGNLLGVPLESLARERGGNKLMANTVALGAALGLVGYDVAAFSDVLREHFGDGDGGDANVAAAVAGYEYARAAFGDESRLRLDQVGGAERLLLTGNEAMALGALAAGCKFVAAYPMTPATSIMEYMAGKSDELQVVVVQPEDEIAAINMIIGAAFAGVRSMTATSGSGLCLMVEGLGLAGITETPIVVVNGQRPGPAVGLPTRTEQGDLEFVIHAAHGEFPRAILAPATIEDAFWVTVKAFNLADRYQLPVIILTDQHLASSQTTVEAFDLSKVVIDRGLLIEGEGPPVPGEYKRYAITESGVSPRAMPLVGRALVCTDADEHDEAGHLIEDAETRTAMVLKRLRKLEGLRKDIAPPRLYGEAQAPVTLVGWGSTYGALKEAVDLARGEGIEVNLVHLNEMWPFPADAVSQALEHAQKVFTVENNATGQLARLIRSETGYRVAGGIRKFDGRPFTPAGILSELKQEVS